MRYSGQFKRMAVQTSDSFTVKARAISLCIPASAIPVTYEAKAFPRRKKKKNNGDTLMSQFSIFFIFQNLSKSKHKNSK
jgi:hypothetical protein